MKSRTPLARAAASVVLAVALLAGTAGCTFISRQATLIQYDPSNGVGASVGDVKVRNAIALINEDGTAVSLLITLVNSGQDDVSVKLQYEANGKKLTEIKAVPAGGVSSFGNVDGEDQIVVTNPGVKSGALMPVYVQYGDNPGSELMVPVLPAEGAYEGLGPVVNEG
ncbi:hypothetical protein QMG83_12430 [Salinibacterium sp. G-O1]|uniref:hypothetical protein n=1 Tax=Salinibacterium sp. G-O1 TaxID=3046208 RepID=UPI0024BBC381|nr:hypothetical protein [Salinibacterium sp. G-O1]MDJ0336033.1 hypothetical protein [Salinibacterium sp. G-O1]